MIWHILLLVLVDPTLSVARQFLLIISTMLKIGFPIAFIIWMLQKFAVFKNGITKQKQIEIFKKCKEEEKIKKKGGCNYGYIIFV